MEGISLSGKTAVVTGGNTGIGKETARELAWRGARVILACRNIERGSAAADDIVKSTGNADVVVTSLDLASLRSIRQFSDDFNSCEDRLDLLVNNAGVLSAERTLTEDGFEIHFGVNHLGHFYLTSLLVEKLKNSAPSRVVTVSGDAYKMSALDWDDLQTTRGWTSYKAYCRSKTANILFSTHLAKILEGSGVTTYSLHPGVVDTELSRQIQDRCIVKLFYCLYGCCCCGQISATEGAQTTLFCCLEPSLQQQSGLYYRDCRRQHVKRFASDAQLAERLWAVSTELCRTPTGDEQSD